MVLTGRSEEECKQFRRIGEAIFINFCYGNFPPSLILIYRKFWKKIRAVMPFYEFQKFMINNYVNILLWKKRVLKEAKETGYITAAFGRRLNLSKRLLNNPSSLYNFLVKGTGADGLKMALVNLYRQLKTLDARIAHVTNDEIIVEARDDITERVAEIMGECMEKPFRELLPNIFSKVDLSIRNTWGIEE